MVVRVSFRRGMLAWMGACGVVLMGAGVGWANSYDGFGDYAAGSQLAGQSGGAGFNGAWFNSGDPGSSGVFTDQAATLNYTGLSVTGGAAAMTGTALNTFYELDHALDTTYGAPGSTLWFSALVRPEYDPSNNDVFSGLVLLDTTHENNGVFIGKPGDGTPTQWGMESFGNGDPAQEHAGGVDIVNGQTTWLVMKVQFNQPDDNTVSLYINPSAGAEPTSADASMTYVITDDQNNPTGEDFTPNAIALIGGLYGTETSGVADTIFDEIHIGKTFSSLVPEPASAGLLLGAGALALIRRRRKA